MKMVIEALGDQEETVPVFSLTENKIADRALAYVRGQPRRVRSIFNE